MNKIVRAALVTFASVLENECGPFDISLSVPRYMYEKFGHETGPLGGSILFSVGQMSTVTVVCKRWA